MDTQQALANYIAARKEACDAQLHLNRCSDEFIVAKERFRNAKNALQDATQPMSEAIDSENGIEWPDLAGFKAVKPAA